MEFKEGDKVRIDKGELDHHIWEVKAVGMNLPEGSACLQRGANIQMVSCDHLKPVEPEPVIEGDTVEKEPCVSSRSGCNVIAIEKVGKSTLYALHQVGRACACVAQPTNTLTLIRKGPKEKVLWWDEWGEMPYSRAVDKIIQAYRELDPDDKHGVKVMLRRKA
jgi:hypothetical protein